MPRALAILLLLLLPWAVAAQQSGPRPEIAPSDGPYSIRPRPSPPIAAPLPPPPRPGDTWEISRVMETSFSGAGVSNGQAYDRDVLVERMIAVREGNAELEYDLPRDTSAEARASTWQYPVRVLRSPGGSLQLLNGPELEARVGRWLESAHWTRDMCGRWIFTWNAFRIECDPAAVLASLAALDVTRQDLTEGAAYEDPYGAAPASLRLDRRNPADFVADVALDPEKVRRELTGSDAAMAEIMGDTPALRAIRAAHMPRRISGSINVRFEWGGPPWPRRRIRVIRLNIEQANGEHETRTMTETIERRLVSPPHA